MTSVRRAAGLVVLLLLMLGVGCAPSREQRTLLRIGYQHELVTLDPFGHDDAVTRAVLGAIYEPLVRIGPMLDVEPCLAERWETIDDLTWRFRLRQGVRFHDGSEVTATNVVDSLRHALEAADSAVATYLTAVQEVREVAGEPGTVEVRTRYPAPLLLARLSLVAVTPKSVLADPGRPVGTGPYVWVDGTSTGPVRLRVWEHYWGPAPFADDVVANLIPEEEELARRVVRGELDVAAEISASSLPGGTPGPGWKLVPYPPLATTILACNVRRPPLDDPRVREAIDLAIDRRELARAAGPNRVEPAYGLVPQGVVGSVPIESIPQPDPVRAKELLAAAGYPDGVEVELAHAGVWGPAVSYLEEALGRVGIRLRVRQQPYDEFYQRILNGECSLYIFGWTFPFGDASDLLEGLVHTRVPGRRLGLQNGSGYSDPEVDRLIEQAAREPGTALRQDAIRKVLARLAADRPYIPLYHRVRLAAVREELTLRPFGGAWLSPQCVVAAQP